MCPADTASVSSAATSYALFVHDKDGQKRAAISCPPSDSNNKRRNAKSVKGHVCESAPSYCSDENAADNDELESGSSTSTADSVGSPAPKRWCERLRGVYARRHEIWLPVLLCFYAILKEIKVGEPFIYKYQTEYLNLTADQITGQIYPFTPYAQMLSSIPIFLLTDLLLYKPTMLLEMIGQVVFRSTQVFGGSVSGLILGQIFYGIASASEIAFFSYIYARLEKHQYQRLTNWTRAGTMAGRTCGYLFSQALMFWAVDQMSTLRTLNIIALAMPCLVLLFCAFLPRVHWKLMVGRILDARGTEIKASSSVADAQLPRTYAQYARYRLRKLGSDFRKIYSIGAIRKWSMWWAMTTCMSLQVALFSQRLWGDADIKNSPLNGLAEAAYTATAAIAILAMNAFAIDWDRWGELALVIISSLDAATLLLYSHTRSIYVMYGCYICYRSLYQVMITIAQWNIAKKMVCESYGLVFGTNSFIALVMQTVLTFIVTDVRGLNMHVRPQYLVYSILHIVIAIIFLSSLLIGLVERLRQRRRRRARTTPALSVDAGEKMGSPNLAAIASDVMQNSKPDSAGHISKNYSEVEEEPDKAPPLELIRQRQREIADGVDEVVSE